MSSLMLLAWDRGEDVADLRCVEGIEDDFELLRGVPRLANWPKNALFRMDPTFPNDTKLEDVLRTGQQVIVASERFKSFLVERAAKNNEFLPVQIRDHQNKPVREPYWLIHQIHLQPIIDEARSTFDLNDIDPKLIFDIETLVVDDTRLPPEIRLFRMARYPFIPVFDGALAAEIIESGFTGMRFDPLDEFTT